MKNVHECKISLKSHTGWTRLVWECQMRGVTLARGTLPFRRVAAASYSGASFLQWPHLEWTSYTSYYFMDSNICKVTLHGLHYELQQVYIKSPTHSSPISSPYSVVKWRGQLQFELQVSSQLIEKFHNHPAAPALQAPSHESQSETANETSRTNHSVTTWGRHASKQPFRFPP